MLLRSSILAILLGGGGGGGGAIAVVTVVFAQEQGAEAMHEGWMADFVVDMVAAEDVLKAKDESEWTQDEIEAYLFNALYAIYNAENIYVHRHRQHSFDGEVLRNTGILSTWPGNPFNNWEPITWGPAYTEFVPGGIVILLCPPDWYSGLDVERPLTYCISINGPSDDYVPIQSLTSIFDWAAIPMGTAFQTASYWEPASSVREKHEQKMNQQ